MDPTQILSLLPFLKSLVGGSGGSVGAGADPTAQAYMGGLSAMPQLQQLSGTAQPVAQAMSAMPSQNQGQQLADYALLMKAIGQVDPNSEGQPPRLRPFRFGAPAPAPLQCGKTGFHPSVGAYLASPAGQQILRMLQSEMMGIAG